MYTDSLSESLKEKCHLENQVKMEDGRERESVRASVCARVRVYRDASD
jgi:hypothetical protein